MSEMMANKGTIKELYRDIENPEEKLIYLHEDTEIPFDDLVSFYNDEPDWDWIEHDDYSMILDRLFDVSLAPDSYDSDGERYHVKKIAQDTYEVDLYYYNGGTNMEELVADYLQKEGSEEVAPAVVFYAVMVQNTYWLPVPQPGFNTPLLFTSEAEAIGHMTARFEMSEEEYKVVEFRSA